MSLPSPIRTLQGGRSPRFRLLIHGATKLGKSTCGSRFHSEGGKSLVIPWGGLGYQALADTDLVIKADETPYTHKELVGLLPRLPLGDYDSVAIDDLQGLIEGTFSEVAERYEKESFDEVDKTNAWPAFFQRFFDTINDVARRARCLLVISREQYDKTLKREISRIWPDVPPKLWKKMEGDFDFIGHASAGPPRAGQPPVNLVRFTPSTLIDAGARWSDVFPQPVPLDGRAIYDRLMAWAKEKPK